jgi:hypothetical protein
MTDVRLDVTPAAAVPSPTEALGGSFRRFAASVLA